MKAVSSGKLIGEKQRQGQGCRHLRGFQGRGESLPLTLKASPDQAKAQEANYLIEGAWV